ncbi:MAG: RdgB/HAM1 family non-canonical purine NTP pyrophosphatase [Rhizobiaceae bacterium]
MKLQRGDRLVLATHNEGKLKEFRQLMEPFGLDIVSAGELGLPEPEETGTTFNENAYTKAFASASASGLMALSDDSGLCVDALDGAPGVYTADWAIQSDGKRDWQKAMARVEDALQQADAKDDAQRTGRFVAVLCLCNPQGEAVYYRGEAEGTLVWPPRGTDGFGYDPTFRPIGHTRTFGEMTAEEKHGWRPGMAAALSHRARAFKLFAESLLA